MKIAGYMAGSGNRALILVFSFSGGKHIAKTAFSNAVAIVVGAAGGAVVTAAGTADGTVVGLRLELLLERLLELLPERGGAEEFVFVFAVAFAFVRNV